MIKHTIENNNYDKIANKIMGQQYTCFVEWALPFQNRVLELNYNITK
jgi:hypothetical protein